MTLADVERKYAALEARHDRAQRELLYAPNRRPARVATLVVTAAIARAEYLAARAELAAYVEADRLERAPRSVAA